MITKKWTESKNGHLAKTKLSGCSMHMSCLDTFSVFNCFPKTALLTDTLPMDWIKGVLSTPVVECDPSYGS